MKVKVIYEAVKKMAESMTQEKDLKLNEVCDFGDSIGFTFDIKDKYQNVYWCVHKKTFMPFTFIPIEDFGKYESRKIIPIDEITGKGD